MDDLTAPTRMRGEVITFYSYKGGTGRTMALANVACLLAERVGTQQSVLVVDWDLEAPGLHRFLPPRLVPQNASTDLGLDATPGLIDIFTTLSEKLPPDRPESEDAAEAAVRAALSSITFESFIADTAVPGVKPVGTTTASIPGASTCSTGRTYSIGRRPCMAPSPSGSARCFSMC